MSPDIKRGHVAPSIAHIRPGSIGLADAKRIAWAFAVGESQAYVPARATRRGDLPDVDFSVAVPVPRRSIWSRIVAAFRAPSSEAAASEEFILETPPLADLQPRVDNVIPFRRAA